MFLQHAQNEIFIIPLRNPASFHRAEGVGSGGMGSGAAGSGGLNPSGAAGSRAGRSDINSGEGFGGGFSRGREQEGILAGASRVSGGRSSAESAASGTSMEVRVCN